MSLFRALFFALAALLIINFVSASNCPPKHKVTSKQTCFSDADCKKFSHQICCLNQFNTKSCTPGSPYMTRDDGRNKNKDKYNGGGRDAVYQPYRY